MRNLILSMVCGLFIFISLTVQAEIVSKPILRTTSLIETVDSYGMQQAQQHGVTVYHPTYGYAAYENIFCDAKSNYQRQFIHLVSSYCVEEGGKIEGNWCVNKQNDMPIFSAELNHYSSQCSKGYNASIIHVVEFLPSVQHDKQTQQNWLQVATAFGYH